MLFGLIKKKRIKRPTPQYSVWLTHLGRINCVLLDLKTMLESKRAVIVVAHFADTFEQLFELMDPAPIECRVLDQSPVRKHVLPGADGGPAMYLLNSEQLVGESMPANVESSDESVAVIIAEIHGSSDRNERVEWFIDALPFEVEVLRHVWMEEPVMQSFVGQTTMEFLEQMGISEHERVEDASIDEAIARALDLMGKKVRREQPARTAEEWIRLNLPDGIGG